MVFNPYIYLFLILFRTKNQLQDDNRNGQEGNKGKGIMPGAYRQDKANDDRSQELAKGETRVMDADSKTTVFFWPPFTDNSYVYRFGTASPHTKDSQSCTHGIDGRAHSRQDTADSSDDHAADPGPASFIAGTDGVGKDAKERSTDKGTDEHSRIQETDFGSTPMKFFHNGRQNRRQDNTGYGRSQNGQGRNQQKDP